MKALVAHYKAGRSNKVYVVGVRSDGKSCFSVLTKWGRVGKVNQGMHVGTYTTQSAAEVVAHAKFREKLKNGYLDIDHPSYSGEVTRASMASVLNSLGVDSGVSPSQHKRLIEVFSEEAKKSNYTEKKEPDFVDEMECVNNTGVEDSFDVGVTYIVEQGDDEFFNVYDKFGEKRVCLKSRFAVPKRRKAGV